MTPRRGAQMAYENWLLTTGTIRSCDWEDPQSRSPASLFVGYFTVVFSYAVEGKQYRGRFHSAHAWGNGTEVEILYNPRNPVVGCVCDEDESRTVAVVECALQLLDLL
jgi:ribosomal protein L35AE/L33A